VAICSSVYLAPQHGDQLLANAGSIGLRLIETEGVTDQIGDRREVATQRREVAPHVIHGPKKCVMKSVAGGPRLDAVEALPPRLECRCPAAAVGGST